MPRKPREGPSRIERRTERMRFRLLSAGTPEGRVKVACEWVLASAAQASARGDEAWGNGITGHAKFGPYRGDVERVLGAFEEHAIEVATVLDKIGFRPGAKSARSGRASGTA